MVLHGEICGSHPGAFAEISDTPATAVTSGALPMHKKLFHTHRLLFVIIGSTACVPLQDSHSTDAEQG